MHLTCNDRSPITRRPTFFVALLTLTLLQAHAAVTPSQQPLLKKAAATVAPNIFYTLDDSGSMSWTYAPFSVWPYEYANVFPLPHPSDDLRGIPIGVTWNFCVAATPLTAAGATRAGLSNNDRVSVDLRSPQYNRIYYNPAILYRPWAKGAPVSDASGLFKPAAFTAANTDPRKIIDPNDTGARSTVINLNTVLSATLQGLSTVCGTQNGYRFYNSATTIALYPATYYLINTVTGAITRYTLNSAVNPPANLTFSGAYDKRTDCNITTSDGTTTTTCSLDTERQNFANWFTYYRTRSLLARGATSLAFSEISAPVRMGYGQLNNGGTTEAGQKNTTVTRGVRTFDLGATERTDFFSWLYKVPYQGGTPLRRAADDVGKYFRITNSAGPWSSTPGTASFTDGSSVWKNQASCRRSYHILMTDGYWNDAGASTPDIDGDNIDGTATTTLIANNNEGRTYKYDPTFTNGISTKPPYRDSYANTLADVAAYYWTRDLHPDLANNVRSDFVPSDKTNASKPYYNAAEKIDRGDHAFWQHLTTYTVGLGISGSINNTSIVPPTNGWPEAKENQPSAVDDLWHAAVNGRGKYLKASDPQEYQEAIEQTLSDIVQPSPSNAGVSFSSFEVTGDALRYVPSFSQPDWTGDVRAYPLNSNTPKWSATSMLPPHGSRQIEIWNGTTAESFSTGLSAGVRTLMGGASNELINFLRGERTLEGSTFRCRGDLPNTKTCTQTKATDGSISNAGLFGDVVNSPPLLLGAGVNMNYQLLPDGEGSGYLDHVATKAARSAKVLLVGANDGMLHLLDEGTGKELYAYIPQAVAPFLKRLANTGYGSTTDDALDTTHHYFVDGRMTESDVKIDGKWTNVVVGSTGAGAKAVFALKFNTATPQSFSGSPLLWEINALSSSALPNKDKLGHVTSNIAVGRMKNGSWVAIFGNGMGSTAGGAYLWMVDMATGAPVRAPIQAGTDTSDNGLGGVTLVRDGNRNVVAAYAGDAKGRLWRFDLESTSSADWKTGFGNTPLLTPSVSTPVSAAPLFTTHPKGGLMVMYATGRLLTAADADDGSQQFIYGVWDLTRVGEPSLVGAGATDSQLVENKLNASPVSTSPIAYGISESSTTITYTNANGTRGWKLKQSISGGERAIYDPFMLSALAVFNTLAPTLANVGDPCTAVSSQSYLYFLMPLSGKMAPYAIADTNGDGMVTEGDARIGVINIASEGGAVQPYRCTGGKCPCTTGECEKPSNSPCPSGSRAYGVASSQASQSICASAGYNVRTWQQIQNFPKKDRQ